VEGVIKVLLDQGNLVACLLFGAVVALYRENRRLVERYETKTENLLGKAEGTLGSVRDLLAHFLRRRPP
jgi:hypothetical protein